VLLYRFIDANFAILDKIRFTYEAHVYINGKVTIQDSQKFKLLRKGCTLTAKMHSFVCFSGFWCYGFNPVGGKFGTVNVTTHFVYIPFLQGMCCYMN
jgi:hypothetical protein